MLYLDMVQGRTCSAARITSTCVRKRRGRSLARSLSRTFALSHARSCERTHCSRLCATCIHMQREYQVCTLTRACAEWGTEVRVVWCRRATAAAWPWNGQYPTLSHPTLSHPTLSHPTLSLSLSLPPGLQCMAAHARRNPKPSSRNPKLQPLCGSHAVVARASNVTRSRVPSGPIPCTSRLPSTRTRWQGLTARMHNTPPRECITARRLAASVHVASADEAAQQLEQIPGSGAVSSPDAPAGGGVGGDDDPTWLCSSSTSGALLEV